jgi:hypothetical protein
MMKWIRVHFDFHPQLEKGQDLLWNIKQVSENIEKGAINQISKDLRSNMSHDL